MLESITLENFLSFRDSTIFNFRATTEKPRKGFENIDWFTKVNNKKILKAVFLFGNNGSGKSNFLSAFNILTMFTRRYQTNRSIELPSTYFKFEKKYATLPSKITAILHKQDVRYTYSIAWTSKYIVEESLTKQSGRKKDIVVFSRECIGENGTCRISFSPKLKYSDETKNIIIENTIPNTSVLSVFGVKNIDAPEIATLYDYFSCPLHFNGLDDSRLDLCDMLTKRRNQEEVHDTLIQMLSFLGSNIKDIKVDTTKKRLDPEFAEFLRKRLSREEYESQYPNDMESVQYLRCAHSSNDKDDDSNSYIWLTEGEESQGTLNMIRLMIILIDSAKTGALTTIDECAMGIHQETFNRIIQFYLSISNDSQVFFATQLLTILDMEGYRRDSARFFNKEFESGISTCESIGLREFHANKNIYKNYVDHAFGGIPLIPPHDEWLKLLAGFKNKASK